MKKLIKWFLDKIERIKRNRKLKKKIAELKKRDPFVYKH
jgi:hypothetical protein